MDRVTEHGALPRVQDDLGLAAAASFRDFLAECAPLFAPILRYLLRDCLLTTRGSMPVSSAIRYALEEGGAPLYPEKVADMFRRIDTTLYVDFSHVALHNQSLAEFTQREYFRY